MGTGKNNPSGVERRRDYLDGARFGTQKLVTYIILLIFSAVVANILMHSDQSERSIIIQTVINITLIGVGYWLGSSKGVAEEQRSPSAGKQPENTP